MSTSDELLSPTDRGLKEVLLKSADRQDSFVFWLPDEARESWRENRHMAEMFVAKWDGWLRQRGTPATLKINPDLTFVSVKWIRLFDM